MWRFNSAERREKLRKENPEEYKKYLETQKKLMRRKYEERRKAESGGKVRHRKEV
jgi:hypothetical protein